MKATTMELAYRLVVVCCCAVLVAVGLVLAGSWWLRRPVRGTGETLTMHSQTNAERASIVVTNESGRVQWWCGRGIVTSNKTKTQIVSTVVCTGPMEPYSTVVLEAPYAPGGVHELCKGDGPLVSYWGNCGYTDMQVD